MSVLVVHASRYGATRGIAERIAANLRAAGHTVDLVAAGPQVRVGGYDAYVVGSAAYLGSWEKQATGFVLEHQEVLSSHPVWLFSSGPLGTEPTDAEGRDLLEESEPRQFSQLKPLISPRGTQVFFGALQPERLGLAHRALRLLPAGRSLLPEGDFRDWDAVDRWSHEIAAALPAPTEEGEI
jgi:menaquinone-dependent protoporphyrinogen oxidase